MLRLNISSNAQDLRRQLEGVSREQLNIALARIVNDALDGAEIAAKTKIRETYNVTYQGLNKAFRKRRATAANPYAVLQVSGKPFNVIGFDARQTKTGVSVSIKGSRKVIRHAFITNVKGALDNAFRGVYIREGKGRYPIRPVLTISVPGMFNTAVTQAAIDADLERRFQKSLDDEIDSLLK